VPSTASGVLLVRQADAATAQLRLLAPGLMPAKAPYRHFDAPPGSFVADSAASGGEAAKNRTFNRRDGARAAR
jgi:hypothetical protein